MTTHRLQVNWLGAFSFESTLQSVDRMFHLCYNWKESVCCTISISSLSMQELFVLKKNVDELFEKKCDGVIKVAVKS